MPDTRRIAGPENTQSPFDFEVKEVAQALIKGKRADGRAEGDHRPLYLKAGLLSQAKGSAMAEFGQTKVVCAVYGPREVARREDFSIQGQINCDVKFAPFSCRVRRPHVQDLQEKDFSSQLLEAVEPAVRLTQGEEHPVFTVATPSAASETNGLSCGEKPASGPVVPVNDRVCNQEDTFPKSQVDIYVTVLENDGSVLSTAIICACLALADAGIEMYDLVVACTAHIHGETVLIDPSGREEKAKMASEGKPGGELTVAFMPSLHQVSALCFQGDTDLEVLTQASQQCQNTCQKLYQVLQETLVRAAESDAKKD